MVENNVKMNRLERISRFFLYAWILWGVIVLVLSEVIRFLFGQSWTTYTYPEVWTPWMKPTAISSTPLWYQSMMYTMLYIWIILIIIMGLSAGYILFIGRRNEKLRRIVNMTDQEIIEKMKIKNFSHYKFLREISHDGQIVSKVRDSAKKLLNN